MAVDEEEIIDPFDNDEKKARDTAKALKMKRDGKSNWEIADALNISTTTVSHRLKEGYAEIRKRAADEHYAVEYLRLEQLHQEARQILQRARDDDPELALKAMDRLFKGIDARVKLTGVAAPEQTEVNVTADVSEKLTNRLRQAEAALKKKRRKSQAGETD
jgi:transposase